MLCLLNKLLVISYFTSVVEALFFRKLFLFTLAVLF